MKPTAQLPLVLASASPRRRAILAALSIPFVPIAPPIEEAPLPGEAPEALTQRLALAKARAGANQFPGRVALGADTVVTLDSQILGKPETSDEAWAMLRQLRGRDHRVVTAVAVAQVSPDPPGGQKDACRVAGARVWMRPYGDEEIRAYVDLGEPFDKAGGYAIQDEVFRPVECVEGCYLSVVGLPIPELCAVLADIGAGQMPSPQSLSLACKACARPSKELLRVPCCARRPGSE